MARRPHLKAISSAATCGSRWADLPGTDRVRRCSACGSCVYRLQGLSSADGDALLAWNEGGPVRALYARTDGTFLTRNCEVGQRLEQSNRRRDLRSRWAALMLASSGLVGLAARAPEEAPPSHEATPLDSDREGAAPVGVPLAIYRHR